MGAKSKSLYKARIYFLKSSFLDNVKYAFFLLVIFFLIVSFIGVGFLSFLVLLLFIAFSAKSVFYFVSLCYLVFISKRRFYEVGVSIFDQRLSELGASEKCVSMPDNEFKVIISNDGDLDVVKKYLKDCEFERSFLEFKESCLKENPCLNRFKIVCVEVESDTSLLVYFDGVAGTMFLARYDGEWSMA